MMAEIAAHHKPGAVGDQAGDDPGQQGKGKAELMLGRQGSGGQEHRGGGQRNAALLHQNPSEEQKIAVGKQNMCGQSHRDPVFAEC